MRPEWRGALTRVPLLGAVLCCALATGALGARSTPARCPLRSGELTLEVGGVARSALVHVPGRLPAGARVPLLLALHGAYHDGAAMQSYSGFSPIADRERFIVAYPSSHGPFWNSDEHRGWADDVGFLRALISRLTAPGCVDPARVFAAGVSSGAGMVVLAGCRLSGTIAAVASVAGGYGARAPCRFQRPVSLLEIHGTADPVVPYSGQQGRPAGSSPPPYVTAWAARDRCASEARPRAFAPRVTLYAWHGCASQAKVEHLRIDGGRHQWPGAHPADPGPPATFCASCAIWRFLAALRGPRIYPAGVGRPATIGG